MSIWKRIMDAVGALAKGEPLSAVIERLTTPPERTVAFTIAVIALGAKMAKADGRVTRDEIAAFRRVFHIPEEDEDKAARIYNMARTEVAGFEIYAAQMAVRRWRVGPGRTVVGGIRAPDNAARAYRRFHHRGDRTRGQDGQGGRPGDPRRDRRLVDRKDHLDLWR